MDAGFIWTEPHSRRLKVKLTIQAEVLNGAILQQAFVVEYVVETHMCPDCTKTAANPNTWTACVQVGAAGHRCSAGVRVPTEHQAAPQDILKSILWHGTKAAPSGSLEGMLSFRPHSQLPQLFPGPQSGRRINRLHPPLPPAAA